MFMSGPCTGSLEHEIVSGRECNCTGPKNKVRGELALLGRNGNSGKC